MATQTAPHSNPLIGLAFPRTGKRGVPQQFPRRLFEMLEKETKRSDADISYQKVISWSESGKAFRIYNVSEFATSILPKYFRTKKFSSFQRNLNLVRSHRSSCENPLSDAALTTHHCPLTVWLHQGATRNRHGHVRPSFLC